MFVSWDAHKIELMTYCQLETRTVLPKLITLPMIAMTSVRLVLQIYPAGRIQRTEVLVTWPAKAHVIADAATIGQVRRSFEIAQLTTFEFPIARKIAGLVH
jgi:hypothetical protein